MALSLLWNLTVKKCINMKQRLRMFRYLEHALFVSVSITITSWIIQRNEIP